MQSSPASSAPSGSPVDDGKVRLPQLDVLRGVCALMLVFYHATFAFPGRELVIVRNGSLFVDFFFVLSGFIMFHNYAQLRRPDDVSRFMTLRFFRIYPLHLAMLLAFAGYELLVFLAVRALGLSLATPPFSENNAIAFLSHLALLNGFNFHLVTFNFPAWSISVEFWTYALFAACVCLAAGRPRHTLLVFGALACAGLIVLTAQPVPSLTHTDDHMFARCVFGFFLGAVLRVLLPAPKATDVARPPASGAGVQLFVVLLALVLIASVNERQRWLELLAPLAFALVIACFVLWPDSRLIRVLRTPPLLLLGTLSYSIYMVHILALRFVEGALRFGLELPAANGLIQSEGATGALALVVYVALTLGLSLLTYRYIEDPGRAFGRKLLGSRLSELPLSGAAR